MVEDKQGLKAETACLVAPCGARPYTEKKVLALRGTGSRKTLQTLGTLGSFGFMMVASVVIGLVAGYYVDRLLGLENCFVIVGAILGIVAGSLEFFRLVKVFLKDEDKDRK